MDIQNGKYGHADHGCDFHPLVEHMNQLRNFTIGEIHEFSAVPFSYLLILDQTLSFNSLMILQKKLHKSVAQTSKNVAVDTR